MLEIKLFGFNGADSEELLECISEALDLVGLKASGVVTFIPSWTHTCLDRSSFPNVAVCSDDQATLDSAAAKIHTALGVAVKKEMGQFLYRLPDSEWAERGR